MRGIDDVKAEILDRLVRAVAIAGIVAYVPSIYACFEARLWALAFVDSAALAAFIAASRSRRMGHSSKLALLVGASLAIAAAVLYATGPFGAGYVWLLCALFSAALLGSTRILVATTALAISVLGAYGLLIGLGRAPHGQPLLTILVVAANLAVAGALVSLTARRLVRGLGVALEDEKLLAARLQEELETARAADLALRAEIEAKEALLKELNHRVRNNIQVVTSLIRLDAPRRDEGQRGAPEACREEAARGMERRLRALAVANELFLADPQAASVELRALAAGAAESIRSSRHDGLRLEVVPFSYPIPAEYAAGLSIVVTEIAEALADEDRATRIILDEDRGALRFEWEGGASREEGALGEALAARPVVAALAPRGLYFEPGAEGGRPGLVLRLPPLARPA
jgi:hypothetical protein